MFGSQHRIILAGALVLLALVAGSGSAVAGVGVAHADVALPRFDLDLPDPVGGLVSWALRLLLHPL